MFRVIDISVPPKGIETFRVRFTGVHFNILAVFSSNLTLFDGGRGEGGFCLYTKLVSLLIVSEREVLNLPLKLMHRPLDTGEKYIKNHITKIL